MPQPLSIAVIGSGISGLSAAWLLSHRHAVTLYEKEARLGGHSNTIDVPTPDGVRAVDTGFIVYNTRCYPNLIAMFEQLGVETAQTRMSFAVSLDNGSYEYSGTGITGLFGQPANALRPQHWQMLADVARFFREAQDLAGREADPELTLGEFLTRHRYSRAFIEHHIAPMAAAIWSTDTADVLAFPAAAFARFFANHGLLQARNRPQWRTVVGGSRQYVRKIRQALGDRVRQGVAVTGISRVLEGVVVADKQGGSERFDACVVATHADQALALLGDADRDERELLGAFRYQRNTAVVHSDAVFMPRRRRLWASWNFIAAGPSEMGRLNVSYWMNSLQPLATGQDIFVTLNPDARLAEPARIAAFDYDHPVFDRAAMRAQRRLGELQGRRRTWFAGSYFGFGFHEDGLQAGLAAAEHIGGVRRPWTVAGESDRIHLPVQPGAASIASMEPAR